MRRATSVAATILLLGVAGLTAGCGDREAGSGASVAGQQEQEPAAKKWPTFDPPTRFDAAAGVELPDGSDDDNVMLHGTMAFIGMDRGLQAFDLTTGKSGPLVRPERTPVSMEQSPKRAPVLAELSGRPVVAVPVLVVIPAVGTNPESYGIDLLVADAATGEKVSVIRAELADKDLELNPNQTHVRVVGVSPGLVVVSAGEQVCLVVDLAAGKVTWRRQDFKATALTGDTVIGVANDQHGRADALGLAVADGQERWTAMPGTAYLALYPAGPNFVVATGGSTSSSHLAVIRKDGSVVGRTQGSFTLMTCRYDEVSVTVCASDGDYAFALSAASNEVLWSLPQKDSRRKVPVVTAVWHGAVYGRANDQPVVLDAKTGADREPSPGIAPVAVNAHGGVTTVKTAEGLIAGLAVHPATG
jgi:hypothetical protein